MYYERINGSKMEYSKYNIYIKDYPRIGHTTIYNLFKRQIICVQTTQLKHPALKIEDKLRNGGFLVPSHGDEFTELQQYYDDNTHPDELLVMLMLTRACNCSCVYCYEDQQNAHFGDVVDIDKTISTIEMLVKARNTSKIRIAFFGGEPLLKKDIITKISEIMHAKYGGNYRFAIVTNGTLLHREDATIWSKLGLYSMKITLDGCAACHNLRRPYKNGRDSYLDIVSNLEETNGIIPITLNIVLDDSISGVVDLVDDLQKRNINPEYSLCVKEPNEYSPTEKANLVLEHAKILAQKGAYQSTRIAYDHGIICMGKNMNAVGLDGDGTLYQCDGYFKSIVNSMDQQVNRSICNLPSKCIDCTYLPICFGVCLYEHICEAE